MLNFGKRKSKKTRVISFSKVVFHRLALIVLLVAVAACGGADQAETPTPFQPALTETVSVPQSTQSVPAAAESPAAGSPIPLSTPAAAQTESPAGPTPPEASQTSAPVSLPDAAGYTWAPVVSGLENPIGLANAGDGSGRLFILEQAGRIQVIRDDQLQPEPFLDIRDRVGSSGSEQGLLGLDFHPRFAENGQFFINYTDQSGDTVIARYRILADDPERADPASEERLLHVDQPYANHNGGMLAFGPDGYLYIGLGDGGSAGDPLGNGQSTETLLGKILRIDVEGGDPYGIPPDNPFAQGGGRPEIWAFGLRNPWRFSFDRQTGDLYTGDVGQGTWEEVDYQPAGSSGGENYGWDIMEGQECFNAASCDTGGLTLPVFVYPTHTGGSCAVTGGYVYRGESLPAFQGVYLLGDYCSGQVWGLLRSADGAWQSATLFQTGERIASFGEDEAGEIYIAGYSGTVYRLSGS